MAIEVPILQKSVCVYSSKIVSSLIIQQCRDRLLGRGCTQHQTCDAYLGTPYTSYKVELQLTVITMNWGSTEAPPSC